MMKRIVLPAIAAFTLLILPALCISAGKTVHPELPRITAEELKKLIDEKGEFILVDSRDSGSYNKEHIKGAINIHFDPTGDPMARRMTLMAIPMDKLIVVYCA
ncbi:rhodanese-like domain-containing protein [Thermodesulfobacteriota bacterium]